MGRAGKDTRLVALRWEEAGQGWKGVPVPAGWGISSTAYQDISTLFRCLSSTLKSLSLRGLSQLGRGDPWGRVPPGKGVPPSQAWSLWGDVF